MNNEYETTLKVVKWMDRVCFALMGWTVGLGTAWLLFKLLVNNCP